MLGPRESSELLALLVNKKRISVNLSQMNMSMHQHDDDDDDLGANILARNHFGRMSLPHQWAAHSQLTHRGEHW